MDNSVTLKMIQEAREALKGIAEVTPIVTSTRLGKNLFIKSENLQKTGSFKIRGKFPAFDIFKDRIPLPVISDSLDNGKSVIKLVSSHPIGKKEHVV